MIAPQKIATPCPYCRATVPVEIHSIVDVGQNPNLKGQFLSGRLNSATCPNCRRSFQVGGALLYHDGSKEFLGIFLPHEINLANKDRQRLIGDLNRRLMDSLPPEQRRAYLFQPKEFITLNGMVEAILAADGITPEMQRAQRERMQLLETILRGASSADALQSLAKEFDAKLDFEFFSMLAAMVEQYGADGDTQSANVFAALYQQLLAFTSFGARARAQQEAIGQINQRTTSAELLNMIVAGSDDQLDAFVAAGRPLIDYGFYQNLTGRIEAAQAAGDSATAQRLTSLRDRILALTAQIDEASRQMLEEANNFLLEVLQAPDPQATLAENWERVDDAFMHVLEMNLQAATQRGNRPVANRLNAIMQIIMQQMQSAQPPEVQFINELLTVEYPSGTRKLLASRRAELTPEFLDALDEVAGMMEQQGQAEVAKRLRDIRGQAALVV